MKPFIIILEYVPGQKKQLQIETWEVSDENEMLRSRVRLYDGYLAAVSAAADMMDEHEMPVLLDRVDEYNFKD